MPSAPASEIRRIVDVCRQVEVETRILPGLFELINGKVSVSQLREVSLEDLLRTKTRPIGHSFYSRLSGREMRAYHRRWWLNWQRALPANYPLPATHSGSAWQR